MDQAELLAQINTATAAVNKIGGETRTLLTKIDDLQQALANANVTTPEIDAAMAALNAQIVTVDGLVPDVVAPAPAPTPAPAPSAAASTSSDGAAPAGGAESSSGDASTAGVPG